MRAILLAALIATSSAVVLTSAIGCGGSEETVTPEPAHDKGDKTKAQEEKVAYAYHNMYFAAKPGVPEEKVIRTFRQFRKAAAEADLVKNKKQISLGQNWSPNLGKDEKAKAKADKVEEMAHGMTFGMTVMLEGPDELKKWLKKSDKVMRESGLLDVVDVDKAMTFAHVNVRETKEADKYEESAYHSFYFKLDRDEKGAKGKGEKGEKAKGKKPSKKEVVEALHAFRDAAIEAGYIANKSDFSMGMAFDPDEEEGKGKKGKDDAKAKGKDAKGKGKAEEEPASPLGKLLADDDGYKWAVTIRFDGKKALKKYLDEAPKDMRKAGVMDLIGEDDAAKMMFSFVDDLDRDDKGKGKGDGGKAGKGDKAGKGGEAKAGKGDDGKAGKGKKGKN